MTNGTKVSVIVGFLNAERFIQETIDSVFAQTSTDWELLLVDDGSTDASTEIAKRCAEQHPDRVRYLHHEGHENRGLCASRNLAVREAAGEYIAILDADDVWLPRKLERQVAILTSNPRAEMVFGVNRYWRSWTGAAEDLDRDYSPQFGIPLDRLYEPPELLTHLYPLRGGSAPCPSDLLIRRETVERVGGFEEQFHRKYQLYEDQAFLTKVYLSAPVFVSSECWDKYRLHGDSCVSVVTETGQYHEVRSFFLNWMEQYLSHQGVQNEEIWAALRSALRPYRRPVLHRVQTGVRTTADLAKRGAKRIARGALPAGIRRRIRARLRGADSSPPVGAVRWGDLRRLKPISTDWGFDRGLPVDRYYIEQFLERYAGDIHGRVLEIKNNHYTRRFGGDRITLSDVLDVNAGNSEANIIADLTDAPQVPSDTYDCIIFTQTLLLIYDFRAAIRTLHRLLKPGGTLLVTAPCISRIVRDEVSEGYDLWRFTELSTRRLFEEVFPARNIETEAHGSVLSAVAFLHGLAAAELTQQELDHRDSRFELIVTLRAIKPEVVE